MLKEAQNNKFCSYLVALEGWRRGLTLKYYSDKVTKKGLHSPGLLFSLSSGNSIHKFYKARGDKVKGKAFSIGSNKFATKKWLEAHDIPVVEGEKFSQNVKDEEIIEYAKRLGFPIVLKPVVGAQGKGVIANIDNIEYLKSSIEYVRKELNNPEVIIERYFVGEEFRLYVIEDEVIAVMNRIPANIIGDGIHTIKQLIEIKNKERKKNPRLYTCLIKPDFEIKNTLKKLGLTFDNVPKENEQIFLREKSNISTGGDSVELTDEFPSEIKQIAIDALKSIPDFPHGGVDIIFNSQKPMEEAAVVLELSPTPQIGSLVFPIKGKSQDVPSAIIDYYFPETKEKRNFNPRLYFGLKEVLRPLLSKSADEVTATAAPETLIYAKQYVVSGKVQGVGYRRWIRKKALESDLYGYAKNKKNTDVEILVAGEIEQVNKFRDTCMKGPKSCSVLKINEGIWKRPIKIGFEIKSEPRKVIDPSQKLQQKPNKEDVYLLQRLKKKAKMFFKLK